jgi:hypothetical protein
MTHSHPDADDRHCDRLEEYRLEAATAREVMRELQDIRAAVIRGDGEAFIMRRIDAWQTKHAVACALLRGEERGEDEEVVCGHCLHSFEREFAVEQDGLGPRWLCDPCDRENAEDAADANHVSF